MSRFYEIPEHNYESHYKETDICAKSVIDLSQVSRFVYSSDRASIEVVFINGFSSNTNKSEGEKIISAWKSYHNSQDGEKLKIENEMLKQMLRDQINGKLETAKLLKEVLEK